ncbi:DUF3419 family protein [Spirulina sp. CCNP1310]|uniref:DUF3419 family protein n=1 Tax=Spirulina sp. CCNP1310 TaxID=3110249 RepID=UPI002B1FE670|nr:DUF3419 family protein [Spirulina sp. CCNP1310]MEA5420369.1 DUF3419 family protein [Spirulina sp. CCNP1310]
MPTEIAKRADFSQIRYGQCWEDTDVLLKALAVEPGQVCLSIASAGDNTLALLTQEPKQVIAVDLNPAQLACLALRVAAYRQLNHDELLQLWGARPATRSQRFALYGRCRGVLTDGVRQFWDRRGGAIAQGFATLGKFEQYLAAFRRYVLPLLHSPQDIEQLLQTKPQGEREDFYDQVWNHRRWQWGFRLFFSRPVLGRWGRDPQFFRYVEGDPIAQLCQRLRYALTTLNPVENPYLQWMLTGTYRTALPYVLRPEQFEPIRAHLDRLQWHCGAVEDYLQERPALRVDRFNLSNIFEYMSEANSQRVLGQIINHSAIGGRWVYWNLFVPRHCPEQAGVRWVRGQESHRAYSEVLQGENRTFFYRDLVIEEKIQSSVRGA